MEVPDSSAIFSDDTSRIPAMNLASLQLNAITTHADLQMRSDAALDEQHVADLIEALKAQDLPRVKVASFAGKLWMADGHYRLAAYRRCNKSTIPAEVIECQSWLEVICLATAANAEHMAKKRSREDKRNAVIRLMNILHTLGVDWSLRKIAGECRVSKTFVDDINHTPVKVDLPQADRRTTSPSETPQRGSIETIILVDSAAKPPAQSNVCPNPQVSVRTSEPSDDSEYFDSLPEVVEEPKPMERKVLGTDNKQYTVPVSDKPTSPKLIDWAGMEGNVGKLVRQFDVANEVRPNAGRLASVQGLLDQILNAIKEWRKG